MEDIYNLTKKEIAEILEKNLFPKYRTSQIWRYLYKNEVSNFDDMKNELLKARERNDRISCDMKTMDDELQTVGEELEKHEDENEILKKDNLTLKKQNLALEEELKKLREQQKPDYIQTLEKDLKDSKRDVPRRVGRILHYS